MDSVDICPVCTLYLRNGISLEDHLQTHPKDSVINALISLTSTNKDKVGSSSSTILPIQNAFPQPQQFNPPWQQQRQIASNQSILVPVHANNSSVIYQQFVSTNSVTNPGVQINGGIIPQYVTIPSAAFNGSTSMLNQPWIINQPYNFANQTQIISTPTMVAMGEYNSLANYQPVVSTSTLAVQSSSKMFQIDTSKISTVLTEPDRKVTKDTNNENQGNIIKTLPVVSTSNQLPVSSSSSNNASLSVIQLDEIINLSDDKDSSEELKTDCSIDDKFISPKNLSNINEINKSNDRLNAVEFCDVNKNYELNENIDETNSFENKKTINNDDAILPDLEFHENNVKQAREDSKLIRVETISPEVSFYKIPKQEEPFFEHKKSKKTGRDSPNNIVIIQNEIVCLPSEKINEEYTKIENELVPEENFKIEQIDKEQDDDLLTQNENEIEFRGIHLMLRSSLINNNIDTTSVVDQNLECSENIRDTKSPTILLNLNDWSHQNEELEESYSRDSLNIRADECMPPKGELSEQESNGALDEWGKIFQESGSGTSYDILARENWELISDSSDSEVVPRMPNPIEFNKNSETILSPKYSCNTKSYKCSICKEIFLCPKERRVHQSKVHSSYIPTDNLPVKNELTSTDVKLEECDLDIPGALEVDLKSDDIKDAKDEVQEEVEEEEEDSKANLIPDNRQLYCEHCKIEFKTNKFFLKHYRSKHKKLPIPRYRCNVCQMTFSVEYRFTEHLKTHPLECTICFKNFYKRQYFKLHLKRHIGVKPYKCETCPKSFSTLTKKKDHQNIHSGAAPYRCHLCKENFRRYSNLVQHLNNRHNQSKQNKQRDYICHCGEVFKTKKRYSWHMEVHDAKPKACTYCSEKFIHASSLTRHMRIAHNKLYVPSVNCKNGNVQCTVCKKNYLKTSLDVHMKTHNGVKAFSCNTCHKTFSTKWNLKLHRWTHATRVSKPFKCNLCQGAFVRQNDYVAHMNSHRNVKPYTCNYCGQQFVRKYNCQRHVKEHERDKSFKCSVCSKEFHRSYYLIDHMKVHSGVRPYACHICGKASSTKSNHNKHVRIHHARAPVNTEN